MSEARCTMTLRIHQFHQPCLDDPKKEGILVGNILTLNAAKVGLWLQKFVAEHDDHGDLSKLKADLALRNSNCFCVYIQECVAEHFMMILSLRVVGISPNRP